MHFGHVNTGIAKRYFLNGFLAGMSPSTSGRRLMAWRRKQQCHEERVR
jgi:hypothetical protein